MPPADKPTLTDAEIERLRQSGLRLDREGRFWHEGEEVRHDRMRRAFLRWIDRLPPPDGRYVLRLDERRFVYLDVDADATPLLVTALRVEGGRLVATLNDGAEETLDPSTLEIDAAGGARCRVRRGLTARLLGPAYYALLDHVEPVDGDATAALLRLGATAVRLPVR